MKKRNLVFVGLLVFAVSHCFGQQVRYNFDTAEDFAKFKTYRWVPIDGVKQSPGLTDQQIRGAFDATLAAKGLTKVDTEPADLFVGYQFAVGTDHKLESYGAEWGYGEGWDAGGWHGVRTTVADRSIIYEGELALDMYETNKHTLAWRGVVSKTIDPNAKQNDRQKHLGKAVKKLMEFYPPVAVAKH